MLQVKHTHTHQDELNAKSTQFNQYFNTVRKIN